jgi:hypothetical protein
MASNKFLNPINLLNLDSDPISATEGDIYYNTIDKAVRVYSNLAWITVGRAPTQEEVQDLVAPLLNHSSHTNISASYDDLNNEIVLSATGDLTGIDSIIGPDYIAFDTSPEVEPADPGSLWWNPDAETLSVQLDSAVTLQIGQEHVVRVKNNSASVAIPEMRVVMFAGATGDTVEVTPALSTASYEPELLLGVTTEQIPADGFGFVTQFGFVNKVDTSDWELGDLLYSDPANPGQLTNVKPSAPNWNFPVAAVTRVHASTGKILVRAIPGKHLHDLVDVAIDSPLDNEVLAYDLASGTWKNQTSVEAGLLDTSATAQTKIGDLTIEGNLTVNGTTSSAYDSFITLNSGFTGIPSENAGIEVERGVEDNVSIRYNEAEGIWEFTNDGTEYLELGSGSGVTVSETEPLDPIVGQGWFKNSTNQFYIYNGTIWDLVNALDSVATAINAEPNTGIFITKDAVNDTITFEGNILQARNSTGATIAALTPVYINGQSIAGDELTFEKANADGTVAPNLFATAITVESVADSALTKLVTNGIVSGLSLGSTGFLSGDLLYVAVGGGLTKIRPAGSNGVQHVAKVVSVENGTLYFYGNTTPYSLSTLPNLETGKVWRGVDGLPQEVTLTTDVIPEGTTNKYYTEASVETSLVSLITGGENFGISVSHSPEESVISFENLGIIDAVGTANQIDTLIENGTLTISLADSPILTTPNIGVATATSINGTTIPTDKTLVVSTDIGTSVQAYNTELVGLTSLDGFGYVRRTANDTYTIDTGTFLTDEEAFDTYVTKIDPEFEGTVTFAPGTVLEGFALPDVENYFTKTQSIEIQNVNDEGLVIRAATNQVANLLEIQAANTYKNLIITATGNLHINGYTGEAAIGIIPFTTVGIGLAIKANSAQTANLQEWQNSSGTILSRIAASGVFFGIGIGITGDSDLTGLTTFSPSSTTTAALNVQAIENQTSNLQQWLNFEEDVVARINTTGDLLANSVAVTGGTSSGFLKANGSVDTTSYQPAGSYQPEDGDLTAIAGITQTVGYLKKTNTDTWVLENSTFLTRVSPTVDTNLIAGTQTFNLLNTLATEINFAGAALTLNIGSTDPAAVTTIRSNKLTTSATAFDLLQTGPTSINFGGNATTLSIGGARTLNSTYNLGANITASGFQKIVNIGTLGASGSDTVVNIGPAVGTGMVSVKSDAEFIKTVSVPTPTDDLHAATKAYVDALAAGINSKQEVKFATNTNLNATYAAGTSDSSGGTGVGATLTSNISGAFLPDELPVSINDRILVRAQTDKKQNGIYIVTDPGDGDSSFILTRSLDFNGNSSTDGIVKNADYIFVTDGISDSNSSFVVSQTGTSSTPVGAIRIGIDEIAISQYSGVPSNINTLGYVTVGTWAATPIELEFLDPGVAPLNNPTFTGNVAVPEPTFETDAANKSYVDQAIFENGANIPEIIPLDDLRYEFDGINNRFMPKCEGERVDIFNPLRLLLTINGIIQVVDFPEYVWGSLLARDGFQVDYDGYLAFSEVPPAGSTFDARLMPGPNVNSKSKTYPFKAVDILLGA